MLSFVPVRSFFCALNANAFRRVPHPDVTPGKFMAILAMGPGKQSGAPGSLQVGKPIKSLFQVVFGYYPCKPKPSVHATYKGVARDSMEFGQIGSLVRHAISFKDHCARCVKQLFTFRGPTAITGRIRAIVVPSIQGVVGSWLRAHIGYKSPKPLAALGAQPPLTNADTSPAIVGVLHIGASLAHRTISFHKGMFAHTFMHTTRHVSVQGGL